MFSDYIQFKSYCMPGDFEAADMYVSLFFDAVLSLRKLDS